MITAEDEGYLPVVFASPLFILAAPDACYSIMALAKCTFLEAT